MLFCCRDRPHFVYPSTHGLSCFHHLAVTLLLQQSQVVPPQPRLFFPLALQDPQLLYRLSSTTTITSALFTRHQASKGSDPTYPPHTRSHAQAGMHTPAQARERLIPHRGVDGACHTKPTSPEKYDERGCLLSQGKLFAI